MKVLVTHADGFVGFHLVRKLREDGHAPVAVWGAHDDLAPSRRRGLSGVEGRSAAEVVRAERPEAVVALDFLACDSDPTPTLAGERLAAFGALLDASREVGVAHLVLGSGAAVYGANEKLPFAATHPLDRPLSMEGASQRSAELLAHATSHAFRLPVTALRLFGVYGPFGRPGQFVTRAVQAARHGAAVELRGGELARRDFTFIDNAVEVLVRAVERAPTEDVPFEVRNLGTGTPTPLGKVVEVLETLSAKKLERTEVPQGPTELLHTWADVRDLQQAYGYRPRTPLAEGLRRTWEAAQRDGG